MGKVAVVTDSMACIPAELVEAYGIHIIPVYVGFGQKVFRDGVDLTPTQFYRMLRDGGHAQHGDLFGRWVP